MSLRIVDLTDVGSDVSQPTKTRVRAKIHIPTASESCEERAQKMSNPLPDSLTATIDTMDTIHLWN
jgi:hypothetical protein